MKDLALFQKGGGVLKKIESLFVLNKNCLVRKVKTNVESHFGSVDSSCSKRVPQTLEIQVYQKRELRRLRWGHYGVLRGFLTLKYKKNIFSNFIPKVNFLNRR